MLFFSMRGEQLMDLIEDLIDRHHEEDVRNS